MKGRLFDNPKIYLLGTLIIFKKPQTQTRKNY